MMKHLSSRPKSHTIALLSLIQLDARLKISEISPFLPVLISFTVPAVVLSVVPLPLVLSVLLPVHLPHHSLLR